MNRLLAAALLFACATASAAEPVVVLGLPLGGKLKMPIRQCSLNELGMDVKSACWVGSPNILSDGTRAGGLSVPGSDTRPKWAAYGTFDAFVGSDGTLTSFTIHTTRADEFVEILNSITGRFGQSKRESRPGSRISSAEWDWKGTHIQLICSSDIGCNTTFVSADRTEAARKAEARRKAIEDARPASP